MMHEINDMMHEINERQQRQVRQEWDGSYALNVLKDLMFSFPSLTTTLKNIA
jgi:hypothetical protein